MTAEEDHIVGRLDDILLKPLEGFYALSVQKRRVDTKDAEHVVCHVLGSCGPPRRSPRYSQSDAGFVELLPC